MTGLQFVGLIFATSLVFGSLLVAAAFAVASGLIWTLDRLYPKWWQ